MKYNFLKYLALMFVILGSVASIGATDLQTDNPETPATLESEWNFSETRERIIKSVLDKKLIMFAEFDHADAARQHGLEMPETTVLVFGNPLAGTPLMLAHPGTALDLPFRVLIRQADNKTIVSWPRPDSLKKYGVTDEELQGIKRLESLIFQSIGRP